MQKIYQVQTRPQAKTANIVLGKNYRLTILTEALVRLEYSEDGAFEDGATQTVWYRDFSESAYRLIRTEDGIEIFSSRIHLVYNEKTFSGSGLSIQVRGNMSEYQSIWRYGEAIQDLGGTARTLDGADGAVKLDHGVISRFGYSVLDDSASQILQSDGFVAPRKKGVRDLYFFGYGHAYKEALQDFYRLTGRPPMLPRYALGNWWSRFYAYTEESYLSLMDRFEEAGIPFTVAVIDMDWHLVDIDPKYGSGWTGYTWNRELFPDPERFLKKLHGRGMHVTLNVHPAEGVRAFEESYPEMAEAMGADTAHEDPVPFDAANPDFLENYFRYLHHPLEEAGVDFWWMDWQQGGFCKTEGLDPLWILNHFHYLDNGRNKKRALAFSRYAGPGSHRYPAGFSGDSIMTWESLDFQPYFTVTASNIGYGWWSHDIGGHMLGYKNDEMEARWVQFGAYSPILRLHSSKNEFNGKEPWRFKREAEDAMTAALRQRHRMIPYLYTMNYRSWAEGIPLMTPLYYEYPEAPEAYQRPNEYFFGSEILAAPITSPRILGLNVGKVTVWLPEGLWYDMESGLQYDGGRTLDMYRTLQSIPVLAKAGAVIPYTDEISAAAASGNPASLHIYVYAGADGGFTLYEDDNETEGYRDGRCARTRMAYMETEIPGEAVFRIAPAEGENGFLPARRQFTIELCGWKREACEMVKVLLGGKSMDVSVRDKTAESPKAGNPAEIPAKGEALTAECGYDRRKQSLILCLPQIPVTESVEICLKLRARAAGNRVEEACFEFLNQAEIGFALKERVYNSLQRQKNIPALLAEWHSWGLETELYGALAELLTAKG